MAGTTKSLTFREMQLAEKEILDAAVEYFAKNKIRYFLDSGTLLGAVRHKGFIPWDDDIDITIPRPDYEKLLRLAKTKSTITHRGKEFTIESYETTGLKYPFAKITNPNIILKSKGKLDTRLWIDVFPIDGAPENNRKYSKLFQKGRKYKNFYHIKYARISGIMKENRSLLNRLAKIVLKLPLAFVPTNVVRKKVDGLLRDYDYEKSYYCYMGWFCNSMEIRYRRQLYDKKVDLEFEGDKYAAPYGYDEYLGTTYGDYMKMPKDMESFGHETTAYVIND